MHAHEARRKAARERAGERAAVLPNPVAQRMLAMQGQAGNAALTQAVEESRQQQGAGPVAVQRASDDEDAITPAPPLPQPAPLAPAPGALNAALGSQIPKYWNDLQWTDSGSGYQTAVLPHDHEVFKAIEEYARISQERAPVTAPAREKTRMAESERRSKDASLSDEVRASHTRRLQEGKEGGPNPPSSALMDIVDIVVCANPTLWQKYITSRQLYQQSLVQHGPGGLEAKGKDRSDQIPWTTGSRPNLGGTAALQHVEGYDRPENAPALPADAGEAFLWHGTGPHIMDKIQETGFAPKESRDKRKPGASKPRYGVLGQGAYLADNASKPQTYFACPQCEDPDCHDPTHPPRQMLLPRALVGSPDFAHISAGPVGHNRRAESVAVMKEGRTSVMSPGLKKNPTRLGATGTNEFTIKDASMLYPEIRVYYRRSAS